MTRGVLRCVLDSHRNPPPHRLTAREARGTLSFARSKAAPDAGPVSGRERSRPHSLCRQCAGAKRQIPRGQLNKSKRRVKLRSNIGEEVGDFVAGISRAVELRCQHDAGVAPPAKLCRRINRAETDRGQLPLSIANRAFVALERRDERWTVEESDRPIVAAPVAAARSLQRLLDVDDEVAPSGPKRSRQRQN